MLQSTINDQDKSEQAEALELILGFSRTHGHLDSLSSMQKRVQQVPALNALPLCSNKTILSLKFKSAINRFQAVIS
jgi:hypothetical protein